MPKGKGTYGSKVGRPPEKEYFGGGSIDARDRSQNMDFGTMYKDGGGIKSVDEAKKISGVEGTARVGANRRLENEGIKKPDWWDKASSDTRNAYLKDVKRKKERKG